MCWATALRVCAQQTEGRLQHSGLRHVTVFTYCNLTNTSLRSNPAGQVFTTPTLQMRKQARRGVDIRPNPHSKEVTGPELEQGSRALTYCLMLLVSRLGKRPF